MSRRCCCRRAGCLIFADPFNRRDSTILGGRWLEDVGDSEIAGKRLRIPPAGRVICTVPHPRWDATANARVAMKDIVQGKRFRLNVDFVDDEDDEFYRNYLFAEYEAGPGGNGWLKVGSAVAGLVSYLHVLPGAHEPHDVLEVCRGVGGIYAQTSHAQVAWSCVGRAGTGRYGPKRWKAGLENPGTVRVEFDNFQYWQHYSTDPDCSPCECDCEGFCIGKTIGLTFEATGHCACLKGASMNLAWDDDSPGDWVWKGEDDLPDHQCPEGFPPVTHEYELYCAETPEEWLLMSRQGIAPACSGGWDFDGVMYYTRPSSYTCDPFTLTFGPFNCDWSCMPDPCICTYYIIATAA